ncbi:MAG: pyruvate kinase alpha/beta domain-containing protein [Dehalococcoidales bacterium]|nr:pyruvate kinase alpha/beta domain-containing protein [Dehalococcoidales bacterium]
MEARTVYFDKPGEVNTEEALKAVKRRADELGIKTVLVASTRGEAAVKAIDILQGLRVIAVSHSTGFREPNQQRFTDENRKYFESKGGTVLTTSHIFAGVSRAMRNTFNTFEIGDTIASTLRIFGEGMKVVCEISMMACDSGLVPANEDVISVAGSSRGSDTAVVLTPVNSHRFFALKVKEIICKPHF